MVFQSRPSIFRVMGDSSSARNITTNGDDPQFEADLELAKRLSLETFESEKHRWNANDRPFASQQYSGIMTNFRNGMHK